MNCRKLRVIYAGTPDFSVPALQALFDSDHVVIAVFTQPDRPAGRGRKLVESPVKQLALQYSIPIFQPETMRGSESQIQIELLQADVMVVAAYGMLLPESILNTPVLGSVNIHASLLPRWRGAAPIQRAIEAGDSETGITFMQMDKGLDTGNMLHKTFMVISQDCTAQQVHDQLAHQSAHGLLEMLPKLCGGELKPQIQDGDLSTYAHKLNKKEAEIDWSESAYQIHKKICAFNPFPVAYTKLGDMSLRIWKSKLISKKGYAGGCGEVVRAENGTIEVGCGTGVLQIVLLQLPGKKVMDARSFLNGHKVLSRYFD